MLRTHHPGCGGTRVGGRCPGHPGLPLRKPGRAPCRAGGACHDLHEPRCRWGAPRGQEPTPADQQATAAWTAFGRNSPAVTARPLPVQHERLFSRPWPHLGAADRQGLTLGGADRPSPRTTRVPGSGPCRRSRRINSSMGQVRRSRCCRADPSPVTRERQVTRPCAPATQRRVATGPPRRNHASEVRTPAPGAYRARLGPGPGGRPSWLSRFALGWQRRPSGRASWPCAATDGPHPPPRPQTPMPHRPPRPFGRQPTTGHQPGQRRRAHPRRAPGGQCGDDPSLGPQLRRVAAERTRRRAHRGTPPLRHQPALGQPQAAACIGPRQDHVRRRPGEQPRLLLKPPALARPPGPWRTQPMTTGGGPHPFERPLRTRLAMTAEPRGATRQDGPHRPADMVRSRLVALIGRLPPRPDLLKRALVITQQRSSPAATSLPHDLTRTPFPPRLRVRPT
jgi:hypothetical protein